MALDPAKFQAFRGRVDAFAENVPAGAAGSQAMMELLLGEAFAELAEIVEQSRPPRLYVFGRSGAGKSSLINALANQEVTPVGAVEPTTLDSQVHHVSFEDRYASWDVVDSRGLFESVPPEGGVPADTVAFLREDLRTYRPDVLVHVMTPEQVRAGADDFAVVERLREELGGLFPPVVYCLNKVDTHAGPGADWPPEDNPALAGEIKTNLDFVARVLEEPTHAPFEPESPIRGYEFESEAHVGVVPTYLRERPYWNVETLAWLVGDHLPDSARLQFAQAQRREALMRRMARSATNRVATSAAGVGLTPSPGADLAVLTPMQLGLVGIIGAYSCRDLTWECVQEYLAAMGWTALGGVAAREVARSLVQLVPGAGQAISAGVAGGTTWAIGRSAEAYFFDDRVVEPGELVEEGRARYRDAGE